MVVRGRVVKKKIGGRGGFLNQRKNIVSSRIIGLKKNFASNTIFGSKQILVGREGVWFFDLYIC